MKAKRIYIITGVFLLLVTFALIGSGASFPWFSFAADSDSKHPEHQQEEVVENRIDTNEVEPFNDDTEHQDVNLTLPEGSFTIGSQGKGLEDLVQALRLLGYEGLDENIYSTDMAKAIYHFQTQFEDLNNDGLYGPSTRAKMEAHIASGQKVQTEGFLKVELPLPATQEAAYDYPARGKMVEDPDDLLVLVNKENHLPAGYTPLDLMEPNVPFPYIEDVPKRLMRAEAAKALEALFEASKQEGLYLFAQSGYRSYNRQQGIFASNVAKQGETYANKFSARAGESEHQTGLVMDVTSQDVGFLLTADFANTKEGQWVAKHASEFGFIIRYPKGKEEITGYQFEPWHIRYVGKEAATFIMKNNLTLEEYIEE